MLHPAAISIHSSSQMIDSNISMPTCLATTTLTWRLWMQLSMISKGNCTILAPGACPKAIFQIPRWLPPTHRHWSITAWALPRSTTKTSSNYSRKLINACIRHLWASIKISRMVAMSHPASSPVGRTHTLNGWRTIFPHRAPRVPPRLRWRTAPWMRTKFRTSVRSAKHTRQKASSSNPRPWHL